MAEAPTPPTTPDPGGAALPPECAALRGALHRRADGEELAASEAKALDAHLAACDECASELRRAGEFSTHVSELLSGLKPPCDIRRKVLDRIGPLGGRRRIVIGAVALAAVALAGIAALVFSGGGPLARVTSTERGVEVLAFSGGEWRVRAGARDVRASERVEVAPGGTATLAAGAAAVVLTGPAHVQLEPADAPGVVAVHCIRETSLLARAEGRSLIELVAGGVRVRVSGARVGLEVAPDGGCKLTVVTGEARATDAAGKRTVKAGETVTLAQPAR
jgi:hypothetical protein